MDQVRTRRKAAAEATAELIAVIVAVTEGDPRVLTIDDGAALPSGPFELEPPLAAVRHALMGGAADPPSARLCRAAVHLRRPRPHADGAARGVDQLSRAGARGARLRRAGVGWQSWYRYFPWEDRRDGTPRGRRSDRRRGCAPGPPPRPRCATGSGASASSSAFARWNEELVLQRYELLWEAGLVPEARRRRTTPIAGRADEPRPPPHPGHRHRAAARQDQIPPGGVRADAAVLHPAQLQHAVEALAGRRLHKQNFRRLIEQQDLVEETGAVATETGGRPAKLLRFRRDVLTERAVAGSKLPLVRPS